MKRLLKKSWRKVGLGVRWLAKKRIPMTEILMLRFWPEHLFHYSVYLFRKNHILKARTLLNDFEPITDLHKNWLERIVASDEMIKGNLSWNIPYKSTAESFNTNVLMALHNSAPYDFAGYWHRTDNILNCLDHENVNITCATRPGYPWDLRKHKHLPLASVDTVSGVAFHRLSSELAPYKQGSDFRYIHEYAAQLAKLAKTTVATVIHGHSNHLNGLAAIEGARIAGIESVYEARGFWHLTRLSKEPEFQETEAFIYEESMEKLALKEADKVVTLSLAMKQLIVSWGIDKNKVHVIPNAVNTKTFKPKECDVTFRRQWPVDGFIIGFIGSITPYEGLLDLIQAVKLLRKSDLKVSIVIAGSGSFENELKEVSKGLDYIYLAGRISHNDVQNWYSCFDCCVYPRKNDVVCRYVPPMKVLEAMAMEKPVIVSNLDPLIEMVEHEKTGLVCKPDCPESIASNIRLLMEDSDLYERLAKAGRIWVHKHRTWEENGKRYMQMYSSI